MPGEALPACGADGARIPWLRKHSVSRADSPPAWDGEEQEEHEKNGTTNPRALPRAKERHDKGRGKCKLTTKNEGRERRRHGQGATLRDTCDRDQGEMG